MLFLASLALASPIPDATTQLVLVRVPDVDASTATVQRYERDAAGWNAVGEGVSARIGRNGVAWGRGLHEVPDNKVEGDGRAPMGVFYLDSAYGFNEAAPEGSTWPYRQVTAHDMWVEDPAAPLYNRHVVAPDAPGSRPLTAWEQRHQMEQASSAHALKVAVRHNMLPDIEPGAGSAIFLHVWRRDGGSPTAGCTAMPRADLTELVQWLSPDAHPVLVLLTEAELQARRTTWSLPSE